MNAGKLLWEPMHRGYGAVVALGFNYSLAGLRALGVWVKGLGFGVWGLGFRV